MHPDASATYYLHNFRTVIASVAATCGDLLNDEESRFIAQFHALGSDAQALLVRLIMRSKDDYRVEALDYPEITALPRALDALTDAGLVARNLPVSLDTLFSLTRKDDLMAAFQAPGVNRGMTKAALREALPTGLADQARALSVWLQNDSLSTVHLRVRPVCDRLRLMFFGNLYQDWSEFVITDLGHWRYESVPRAANARGFSRRDDIEACLELFALRTELDNGGDVAGLFQRLIRTDRVVSPPVRARQHKWRFQLGQAAERQKNWPLAREIYQSADYKGSRHRLMRVHEQLGEWAEAYAVAQAILSTPEAEEAVQATTRALPRICRKLGLAPPERRTLLVPPAEHIALPSAPDISVERAVADALSQPHLVVHYVENMLFSSLFGLIFWDVIFRPEPGAFFNDFQAGPADLFHPDFADKRAGAIAQTLAGLDDPALSDRVVATWHAKHGIQNHFVFWHEISPDLLRDALAVIPPAHLRSLFQRLLTDLKSNRSGFPDLIALNATTGSYTLIEVKGPGDRIQDNQSRWMDHFMRTGIPCRLLHASWPAP